MATKVRGQPVWVGDGIVIYVNKRPSKTGTGRDRIWVSVRQEEGPKVWRIGASLAYSQAADIRLEREPKK